MIRWTGLELRDGTRTGGTGLELVGRDSNRWDGTQPWARTQNFESVDCYDET
jgi:hypothetical protein